MVEKVIWFPEDLLVDLELQGIKEISKNHNYIYEYNGRSIPRVTDILKSTIYNKSYFDFAIKTEKRMYESIMNEILETGSMAHEMIEDFLLYGERKDSMIYMSNPNFSKGNITKANNAYNNFINWYQYMQNNNYSVKTIAIEKQIVCPWYGGTCDYIASITNNNTKESKTYILDFKTSREISYEYLLQTMLYLKAFNYNRQNDSSIPYIDGIGVIRIDKNNPIFEYLILDYQSNPLFFDHLNQACNSMIDWFYYLQSTQFQFSIFQDCNLIKGDQYGINI